MNGQPPVPLEEIPLEIRKHLTLCDCSCDHMGFGNYQTLKSQQDYIIPPLPAHCMDTHLSVNIIQPPQCYREEAIRNGNLYHLEHSPCDPYDPGHAPCDLYDPGHIPCDLVSDHLSPMDRSLLERSPAYRHSYSSINMSRSSSGGFRDNVIAEDGEEVTATNGKLNEPTRKGGSGGCGYVCWTLLAVAAVLVAAGVGVGVPLSLRLDARAGQAERLRTARQILQQVPLIDGHNDLPWNIRKFVHNNLRIFNFTADLRNVKPWGTSRWSHTDIQRLRKGRVGAQFWAAYVPCNSQYKNAVQMTLEQVDLIKRLVRQYSDYMSLALSADDILRGHQQGRIVSLIGLEGGHSIQSTLASLRTMYELGVRYMTLTHTCDTPWAESAPISGIDKQPGPKGLTKFGLTVVREMNRLGMIIDLSHVSEATMTAALTHSQAPVIFSHSSAQALCNSSRNVPNKLLIKLAQNGGLVMVSFYNYFLTCNSTATANDVIAHINHIRRIAGIDHVGIGAGYDGINMVPVGLEDVSRYPYLFSELLRDASWTVEDLQKLSGLNLIRVFRKVEQVRDSMHRQGVQPLEELIPSHDLHGKLNCTYRLYRSQQHQPTSADEGADESADADSTAREGSEASVSQNSHS